MGQLRHIAIQVPDLEKAAAFYEAVFGLKRLKKVDARRKRMGLSTSYFSFLTDNAPR
jgi:catechol 2,3-dioxygenase-like lactoylglutathione lyase family enzyme